MVQPRGDTQFELANERTYLAWLRTGLAMVAAGVAADRLLPVVGVGWVREVIGITMVLAGAITAGFARRRWESVDRAVKAGEPVPRPLLGYLVATAIVVNGLAAMFLMIRSHSYGP
jgi:putative membrane protein